MNIVARALVALGRRPDYHQIVRHITHIEPLLMDYCAQWLPRVAPEGWREEIARGEQGIVEKNLPFVLKGRSHRTIALVQYIKAHDLYDPVADGLRSAFEYDKTYFDKIVASLLPLLEKLTTGKIAELIAPDYFDTRDTRPIFDWMEVIRSGGIVYVGLDALTDTTVAAAVGNSMFADLTSIAGRIYKHGTVEGLPHTGETPQMPVISLHADEFNELIGEEFVPLLNKAGGAGFQVTAYTQTWSDVEARIGNRAKAGQVAGNFNTLIMLRVKELTLARRMKPFTIDGWVLLPDHLHCIWTLPPNDADFSSRWSIIKRIVTQRCVARLNRPDLLTERRRQRYQSSLWQHRFWEHQIRNEADFRRHADYLPWNPVKHGYVTRVAEWPYSTFHRFVREGFYPMDWGGDPSLDRVEDFGE